MDGPSAAEAAWYRDMFLTKPPAAQKARAGAAEGRKPAGQHGQLAKQDPEARQAANR